VVRGALISTFAALLLVPAAAAKSTSAPALPLLPLPKAAFGAAAKSLVLARDSGVVSNSDAASQSGSGVTPQRLKKLGRVTGYLLDYGTPFGSGSGVHQVQTEVDVYRSAAQAAKGLAFWRKDATSTVKLKKMGISATAHKATVPALGNGRWAYNQALRLPGLTPLYGYTAEVLEGTYLLDVSVSAGSASAAARLGPGIVRKLDARFRFAEQGRLKGKPVALPAPLKLGPPAHGPAPSGMVLKPADFTGQSQVRGHYVRPKSTPDANALSVYDLTLQSSGPVAYASQEVTRAATPTEAKYFSALTAMGLAAIGIYAPKAKSTTVDVSSVGDNARGVLIQLPVDGRTVYEEAVVLSRGSYIDFALGASQTQLAASDAQSFAAKVAHRFDSGF
jgi:hypothetical protein